MYSLTIPHHLSQKQGSDEEINFEGLDMEVEGLTGVEIDEESGEEGDVSRMGTQSCMHSKQQHIHQ